MENDWIKRLYGEDYPLAVLLKGVRIPLTTENRFSRVYKSDERDVGTLIVSRFMDGSVLMTLSDLQQEWSEWSEHERFDFCQNSSWLHEQGDYGEMLRWGFSTGIGPRD